MPAHPRHEATASPADWLRLLDAVAEGQVRVVVHAGAAGRAVLVSQAELDRLEELAARSQAVQVVLTPRERDVLLLVEQGLSAAGIADALGVAPGTVVQHLAAARRKYGVRTSGEAASRAREASDLD